MAQKWPKMAQKLAPAEKNSTDISAASATFCISVMQCNDDEWKLQSFSQFRPIDATSPLQNSEDDYDDDHQEIMMIVMIIAIFPIMMMMMTRKVLH